MKNDEKTTMHKPPSITIHSRDFGIMKMKLTSVIVRRCKVLFRLFLPTVLHLMICVKKFNHNIKTILCVKMLIVLNGGVKNGGTTLYSVSDIDISSSFGFASGLQEFDRGSMNDGMNCMDYATRQASSSLASWICRNLIAVTDY
uniref:Uncharacterized protein n=1 Tax=Strigamia maritima TaxID=126957 RepID=T1J0I9_STRMM